MDIAKLEACGVDYDDGLRRFSGNTAIYEKHLRKFMGLTLVDEVRDAIDLCDLQTAFEACHKLKAYVGNLSMPVLYDAVCDLTEWLRAGRTTVLVEKFRRMQAEYEKVLRGIEEAVANG